MCKNYITEWEINIIRETVNVIGDQIKKNKGFNNWSADYHHEAMVILRRDFNFISTKEITKKKYKKIMGVLREAYQRTLDNVNMDSINKVFGVDLID